MKNRAARLVGMKIFRQALSDGVGMRFAIVFPWPLSLFWAGMLMKKRKDARINKSLLVNISQNGFERMGVTVNISRRGMLIATTDMFPVHSEFEILLAAADDIFSLTGCVVWNTRRTSAPGENVPAGLGIMIKRADRGYARFIKNVAHRRLLPRGGGAEKSVL
jgi:hypothetical protein